MGLDGLREATGQAVLNANYVARRLGSRIPVLYTGANGLVPTSASWICDRSPRHRDHRRRRRQTAHRLRLPRPTMSFPVSGTLMVEPTESEDLSELDRFCEAMLTIVDEAGKVAAAQQGGETRRSGSRERRHRPRRRPQGRPLSMALVLDTDTFTARRFRSTPSRSTSTTAPSTSCRRTAGRSSPPAWTTPCLRPGPSSSDGGRAVSRRSPSTGTQSPTFGLDATVWSTSIAVAVAMVLGSVTLIPLTADRGYILLAGLTVLIIEAISVTGRWLRLAGW
ncbi:hypothetical protein BWX38_00005 [Acidipropionibacterium acidipropionici]|nr:hypothetical protein BWX38_00005 [Acidipropionibacterium acidipropionici]